MAMTVTQTEPVPAIELVSHQEPNLETTPSPNEPSQEPPDNTPALDRPTLLKLLSAAFSFFVAGVNDGSIGALVPYIIRSHAVSTALVSSIYGANFLGWLTAALLNTHLAARVDLGAMLVLGAACQVVAHALRAWDPPFGLFVVTFWLVSVGQAFQDTHGNTYVASVRGEAHRWLAGIHAMYAAGCLVGPFVATAVASAGETSRWYLFYTFPMGIGVVNLAAVLVAFRDSVKLRKTTNPSTNRDEVTGEAPSTQDDQVSESHKANDLILETLKTPSVWLLSLFFFCYLGSVITASGWVVEYLVDVRNDSLSKVGYIPAGFSGGALLGRILLAEPTHRLGERRMVALYCALAVALQLVFWLVPNIIAASIAVSLIGFFAGPLFATGISVGSRLFPRKIHSTALAFIFVFAQMGGSLFPVITGVVASSVGVAVLQPILLAALVATLISWLLVPRAKSTETSESHQE